VIIELTSADLAADPRLDDYTRLKDVKLRHLWGRDALTDLFATAAGPGAPWCPYRPDGGLRPARAAGSGPPSAGRHHRDARGHQGLPEMRPTTFRRRRSSVTSSSHQ